MKLIDCTKKTASDGPLQKNLEKIQQKVPFLGDRAAQVQQAILERFQRGLDNRFTMIVNFTPDRQTNPIPFILVGPNGISVLNLNNDRGIFRAKEDNWLEMNKKTRQYSMARVNLIKQTQYMALAVSDFVSRQAQSVPEVAPFLLFADPGVHIDTNRPAIRLVLADGIDRLIGSFQQGAETLNAVTVKVITDLFEKIAHPVVAVTIQEEDFFGKDLGLTKKTRPKSSRKAAQIKLPPFLQRIHFSRDQWVLLVVLLFVNILLLMGVILLLVFTAG
jgi:hypothetical protein